jgi:predicted HicB family RNase H-like nuclease
LENQNDYGLKKAWEEWQKDINVRSNLPSKNIAIDGTLHEKIKIYCTLKGINIGDWVQEQLKKSLNE